MPKPSRADLKAAESRQVRETHQSVVKGSRAGDHDAPASHLHVHRSRNIHGQVHHQPHEAASMPPSQKGREDHFNRGRG